MYVHNMFQRLPVPPSIRSLDSEELCPAGLAQPTADLMLSEPKYLAEARHPVATKSQDSLEMATVRATWLSKFAYSKSADGQHQSASRLVSAGTPSQIFCTAPS